MVAAIERHDGAAGKARQCRRPGSSDHIPDGPGRARGLPEISASPSAAVGIEPSPLLLPRPEPDRNASDFWGIRREARELPHHHATRRSWGVPDVTASSTSTRSAGQVAPT